MRSKGGLGRGLSALIPAGNGVQQVDVDLIAPNSEQPRGPVDSTTLQELAQSIGEHGVLQPLIVTAVTSTNGATSYQLIAGERRLQAARLAGLQRVPVLLREATERQRLELALVENIQRADLTPLEEAQAYRRLIDDFSLTQAEVAQRVGRSRVAVANSVRLLGLSDAIRARLAAGEISAGHARALLGLEDEEQRLQLLALVVARGLNVRQTEALVQTARTQTTRGPEKRVAEPDPERDALEEQLRAALATQVRLLPGRRGGRIIIRYYDDDDLQGVLRVLLQGYEQREG